VNRDPEHLLQDPLREVTRKERRTLLGVATTGIAVVLMGLEPKGISAFGITFDLVQYKRLLLVWGVIVLYFLVVFVIYAISDFFAFTLATFRALRKRKMDDFQDEKVLEEKQAKLRSGAQDDMNFWAAICEGVETDEREEVYSKLTHRYHRPSQVISSLRMVVDFFLPALVGTVAIVLLFGKWV
jgi:hypothetical protein